MDLGLAGLLQGQPSLLSDSAPCPTNHCQLPNFTTLRVCSFCENQNFEWLAFSRVCRLDVGSKRNLTTNAFLEMAQEYNSSNDPWYPEITMRCDVKKDKYQPVTLLVNIGWTGPIATGNRPWFEAALFFDGLIERPHSRNFMGSCVHSTNPVTLAQTPGLEDFSAFPPDCCNAIFRPPYVYRSDWEVTTMLMNTCFAVTSP